MSELRNEIIEASKARFEFLKWKLIGVSALGAAGLGLGGGIAKGGEATGAGQHIGWAYLVLTLIPLMCFYVDLLCRHMALRTSVIGTFLRVNTSGDEAFYERFVERTRRMGAKNNVSAFAFEDAALFGSTVALSAVVAAVGVVLAEVGEFGTGSLLLWGSSISLKSLKWAFVASGGLGAALTWWNRRTYRTRLDLLGKLADNKDLMAKLRAEANVGIPAAWGGS